MIVQVSLLFVSLRIGPIELVQSRHLLFEVPVPSQESAQSYMEEQIQGGAPGGPPPQLEILDPPLCVRGIDFSSLYDFDILMCCYWYVWS